MSEGTDPRPYQPSPPDQVIATRRGEVLIKSTILKSDHFPGALEHPEGPSSFQRYCVQNLSLGTFDLVGSPLLTAITCTGCQNKKLLPLLDGAPNFRQVRASCGGSMHQHSWAA